VSRRAFERLRKRVGVIAAVGIGSAVLGMGAGTGMLRARFGATPDAMAERVETAIRTRLNASAGELAALSRRVADYQELISDVPNDPLLALQLFDALGDALPDRLKATTGITVYDATRTPIAWVGRVFEFPANQPDASGTVFVQADPFGPRLVRIEALIDREKGAVTRPPLIVAEQRLGDVRSVPGQPTAFVMQTDLAPVTVDVEAEPPDESARPANAYPFAVRTGNGQLLLRGSVAREDLERTRREAQSTVYAIVSLVASLAILALAASVLEFRRAVHHTAGVLAASLALAILLVLARAVLWLGGGILSRGGWLDPPVDLPLTALIALALVWLTHDLIERWRVDRRRPLRMRRSLAWTVLTGALEGAVTVALLATYGDLLRRFIAAAAFDPLHFSLHPFDIPRVLSVCGLVVLHAAAVWGAAAMTRAVVVARRRPRTPGVTWGGALAWAGGAAVMGAVVYRWSPDLTTAGLLFPTSAAAAAAAVLRSPRGRFRRGSQAARLSMLYVALVVPALSMYPLLNGFAADAKEELIARHYGPLAVSQREDLKHYLARTIEQIDARPSLAASVAERSGAPPDAQPAFEIWRSTDLERYRLTSAIELYGSEIEGGRPLSRFSLRLPQTSLERPRAWGCEWDFVDEVSPIGSSERHVLRASRAFCDRGRRVGAIVVRVMLDYRTLPFIRAESPYMASLGPNRDATAESAPGRDIAFVGYGWSGAPLTTSGVVAWPLPDPVFTQLVESREPLWHSIDMPDARYRVYFLSDRGGIYALGYPVISPLGHLVNIAELIVLASIVYLALLLGATITSAIASGGLSGRALLREVRSSFYRKLVVAFVLSAAVPVFVLAIATSTYFSAQARAGVEAEAIKTVTVAQRLVEDYAQRDPTRRRALDDLDDQTMVIVGRAIDQPVNLFEAERLRATSERDLYASALLTPRTPSDVFRRIVLERQPAFVGEEEVNGSPYLVAAAPVRAGDREGVVTVPQTLRQRETEAQIDEFNRRVVFAAVFFALLVAGFGYWMAERIADPVNRLTRATRRISRGDLDARIGATSSDELRRLVEDFNHMAADLKRQRSELERTQRLEAWADIARQVAHDIKNPLTPIQLSAEHAQRVNTDRGKPLSPVLDECMQVILGQVRLLRQISAEFSSFASSPTARPEPTDMTQLIDEVALPYRATLSSRAHPIHLATSASADVPKLALDRTLFARALTNIIENAVHAMPGGGRLTIESSFVPAAPDHPAHVLVCVVDTGIGMEPEAVARIFEPYFSTKAAGTGLGLTIAKRNVELNHGRIEVTSQRGVGTTVCIRIPL